MIITTLKDDYKIFLKHKNKNLKDCVQIILAEINQYMIDKKEEYSENIAISVIKKNLKQVQELKEYAEKSNNSAIINDCDERISYLKNFLPVELTPEKVREKILSIMKEKEINDKKALTKIVMPILKTMADAKLIMNEINEIFK